MASVLSWGICKRSGQGLCSEHSILIVLFKMKILNFQFRFYLLIKKKTKLESHLPVLSSHHPSVLHTPYYIQVLDKKLLFPNRCRHLTLHTSLIPGVTHTAYLWPQTVSHVTHLRYTGTLQPCQHGSLLFRVRFMILTSHQQKIHLESTDLHSGKMQKKGARNQPF